MITCLGLQRAVDNLFRCSRLLRCTCDPSLLCTQVYGCITFTASTGAVRTIRSGKLLQLLARTTPRSFGILPAVWRNLDTGGVYLR